MTEIFNLSTLCRCCHADGQFKKLDRPYVHQDRVEVYSELLRITFDVHITKLLPEASYSICNDCILKLRDAAQFKHKVLLSEEKFEEYCKNEQALQQYLDNIKVEVDDSDNDHADITWNQYVVLKNDNGGSNSKSDSHVTNQSDQQNDGGSNSKSDSHVTNQSDQQNENHTSLLEEVKDINIENNTEISSEKLKVPSQNQKEKGETRTSKGKTPSKSREINYDPTLEVRVRTENGEIFSCKDCGGSYTEKSKLKQHLLNEHSGAINYCKICDKKFAHKYSYKYHMKLHRNEKTFKCSYCDKTYLKKTDFKQHVNTHTKENVYKCDLCQKEFLYKSILRKHIKWHEGVNKKCICDLCGSTFNDKTNLNIHIKAVHEKLRRFACEFCPKKYAANKSLKVHRTKHTGEIPYACDICSKGYRCYNSLSAHKKSHIKGFERYKCRICHQKFDNRGLFRIHGNTHSGSRPYKCEICGKDFSCKYSKNRHVREHDGIKKYQCTLCDVKFTQKTQLDRHHKRFHDPNRKEVDRTKCELCKRMVSDMSKHLKMHNDRPFACELCDKKYPVNNALNRHIKLEHEGVRPYPCTVCDKKYRHPGSLKLHMNKMHKLNVKIESKDSEGGDFDSCVTTHTIKRGRKRKLKVDPKMAYIPVEIPIEIMFDDDS